MGIKFSVMMAGTYPLRDYIEMGQAIERLGFDELHIADDLIMRPAWPILSLIGANTSRIRLGPAIVTPQVAHPVYHAAHLAALDELTGGRALCGVGRGGFNTLLGVAKPLRPVRRLREAVQLMHHVLCGQREAFDGEFFRVTADMYLQFPAVARDIPIFIGTWGPRLAELAGEIGSGLKADCTANPDYLRTLIAHVQQGAQRVGRSPATLEITVGPLCSIAAERTRPQREMRRFLALYLPYLAPMTTAAGITAEEISAASTAMARGDLDAVDRLVPDAALHAFSMTGTPADVIPQIETIIAAGATHIAFGPPLGPDFHAALALIGKHILPHFRAAGGRAA